MCEWLPFLFYEQCKKINEENKQYIPHAFLFSKFCRSNGG